MPKKHATPLPAAPAAVPSPPVPPVQTGAARWGVPAMLLAITAIGAFLRLAHLDARAIATDELELWRFCNSGISAWGILKGDMAHSMDTLLPAYIQGFREMLSLPLTPYTLRFPGTLLAILSIPLVFLAGRLLFGATGGLLAAALVALSPVHIQCSMEAYPYVLSSAGFALGLWCLLHAATRGAADRLPAPGAYAAFLPAMILMMYASMAAWPLALVLGAAFLGVSGWIGLRRRRLWPVLSVAAILLVMVGPRVWAYLVNMLSRGSTQYDQAAAHVGGVPLFDTHGFRFLFNFAWGASAPRLILLAAVLGLAVWTILRGRRQLALMLVAGLVVLGFFAAMISRYITGNPFWTRFLVPMLPAYALILTAGLLLPTAWIQARPWPPARRRIALALGAALALLPLVSPAWLAARMEGNPYPYRRMVAWADAHFPPNTPVLCDRFFDAYNEFKVNPPTNVIFTATVPNEPLARFQQVDWRTTAEAFFENHPDAVLYEAKMYWAQLGRWEWPDRHFARRQAFLDERYVALQRLGLTYRDMGKTYSLEELPRVFYYNTEDDLVARARAEGRDALALYGPGWTYAKTGDLRDWRVLREEGAVILHVIGDQPRAIRLSLEGAALGEAKNVRLGEADAVSFPPGEIARRSWAPVTLPPGRHLIRLHDPRWTAATRQAPLLVHRLEVLTDAPPSSL